MRQKSVSRTNVTIRYGSNVACDTTTERVSYTSCDPITATVTTKIVGSKIVSVMVANKLTGTRRTYTTNSLGTV